MSQERPENDGTIRPDSMPDERLRALLQAWSVPEPSEEFVPNTMLKVQLDHYTVPEPSVEFVDQVVARVMDEASRPGESDRGAAPREELVPIVDLDKYVASELSESRAATRFPQLLAIVGMAAALLLAFLIGRQSATTSGFSTDELVGSDDFPTRGSNRFARSLSLVVDRVESDFESEAHRSAQSGGQPDGDGPLYPRPVLSLPAPPSRYIPSAVVENHVDRATLESLGIQLESGVEDK